MTKDSIVLVIDDDPITQKQIQLCLGKEGYRVISASNAQEGLTLYQSHPPDLILLDAVMPDVDGFDCCQEILKQPGAEHIPILMITGLEDKHSIDLAFQRGAYDYIRKPINWDLLRQRVKKSIKQARDYKRLFKLAITDKVTQLSNRTHFDDYFGQVWSQACETQAPLALILVDIDSFKLYNDTYLHTQGDICLYQVAQILRSQLEYPSQLLARYGGEEFVIVLPNTCIITAMYLAEKMRQSVVDLQIPHQKSPISPWVTISLGVSWLIPQPDSNRETLIQQADIALSVAKKSGKNRVCVFPQLTHLSFLNRR